jgi:hypothetical protein
VGLNALRLVAKFFHQINKLSATGSSVQRAKGGGAVGQVSLNPLKAIQRTASSTKHVPILRSKRAFVLLSVFVFVKRRNILYRNGIHANKTTIDPANISQGRTMPVDFRDDTSLASASQRTRARGGDDYPITHR